jgi:hypothetical protein
VIYWLNSDYNALFDVEKVNILSIDFISASTGVTIVTGVAHYNIMHIYLFFHFTDFLINRRNRFGFGRV